MDTLTENLAAPESKNARFQSWAAETTQVQELSKVTAQEVPREATGMGELDRVLGGGLVDGAVILLGGRPRYWQIYAIVANHRFNGEKAQRFICFGRRIRATSGIAFAAFGIKCGRCAFIGRNSFGSDSGSLKTTQAICGGD